MCVLVMLQERGVMLCIKKIKDAVVEPVDRNAN